MFTSSTSLCCFINSFKNTVLLIFFIAVALNLRDGRLREEVERIANSRMARVCSSKFLT